MTYPNATPHGTLNQVMDDIYMVTGCVALKAPHPKWGPLSLVFSRNMYVVKQGDELTLINSVRLNDKGLAELEQLGKVKHIIRLAAFHGMDDPFYRETFGATLWSVDAPYVRGFATENSDEYYRADKVLHAGGELPISDASYYEFSTSTPKEGLILLEKESGIMISGDSMQNWATADQYFNWFARFMMPRMGFIAPTNFGPGWLKMAKPDAQELVDKASLNYDALLPAHGTPVFQGARDAFIASANAVKS